MLASPISTSHTGHSGPPESYNLHSPYAASPTSTSHTGHSGIVGLPESYDLHSPYPMKEKDTLKSQFSQENSNGTIRSVDRLRETGFVDTVQSSPPRKRFEGFSNVYRAISWIFGFKEKYSLAFCEYMVSEDFAPAYLNLSAVIFFGGALVGFCLARTMMMKPSNVRTMTVSGQYVFASLFGSKVP